MAVKRLMVVLMLVLVGAAPKSKADKPPAQVPDKLEPYVELSRLCSEYEKQVTVVQWREVWRNTYDAGSAEKWVTPPAPPAEEVAAAAVRKPRSTSPTVTAERVDDRDCAVLDASDLQSAYFPIGNGRVRGEFAIEYVGKAMSERPCDLSISCLAGTQMGPSFMFGAHWNQSNFLHTLNTDGQIVPVPLPRTQLIERDRWYTVRLEVRNGKTTASLDGKVIGSSRTNIDPERAWTPNIYLFQSKIAVDAAWIEAMAPAPAPPTPPPCSPRCSAISRASGSCSGWGNWSSCSTTATPASAMRPTSCSSRWGR